MGQTLSVPAIAKKSEIGGDSKFLYAVSEMQGWRISMEDAHAAVLELEEGKDENSFFAVYDGHGGGTVAKFAGQNVHKRLIQEEAYQKKDYEAAMKRAFLGTDEDLLADPAHTRDPSGCTAVAALVTKEGEIYVANSGDSRSVISVKGEVKPLSFDHKPSNETEKARITAAGGYIEYGRVNGNLALSRALGDFEFKKNYSLTPEKQVITADPDVTVHKVTDEDEFLVVACDGIWDCLSSQQVVDFVRSQVAEGKELSEIGESMCDHCLAPDTSSGAGIGCDNMTVLIVAILNGKTKEEWYQWIKDRVEKNYGYETPREPPQLYAPARLRQFRARMEAIEARDRNGGGGRGGGGFLQQDSEDMDDNSLASFLNTTGLGGFARVLGSTGGISFNPASGILSDNGNLMFGNDDSDDDDSLDEDMEGHESAGGNVRSLFGGKFGLGQEGDSDATTRLKASLDAFEKDIQEEDHTDNDGDASMADGTSHKTLPPAEAISGEAPPPPPPAVNLPNGDAKDVVPPAAQQNAKSVDDAPSGAIKAEGLLDKSEDPSKAT